MSDRRATVAIIGGGAIGTSTLFQLTERGCTDVVLFEKNQLSSGSTSKAAGGVRHVFATPFNVELGKKNIAFFESFEQRVGVDIDFDQTGYMYLFHTERERNRWLERMELYDAHDVDARLLSSAEATDVFPELNGDAILGATYAPECGHVDPYEVTQAYASAALDRGVEIHVKTEVTDVVAGNGDGLRVVTDEGDWLVDHVVNAAGPWAKRVAEMVDVDLPLELLGRRIAVTDPVESANSPLIVDNDLNCYFRSEKNGSILVCDMDADVHDVPVPEEVQSGQIGFEYYLGALEKLERVLLDVQEREVINGWAGVQTHTPDKSPIIDSTEVDGFWVACGFSGHGIQKSPTAGAALADVVLTGETDVFDFDHFSLDRFDSEDSLQGEELNM